LFGSGNRDDEKFGEPHAFDLERPNAREHLAFGHGIHHCPGAPLARQEIHTALSVLRTRIPDLRLAADYVPIYEPTYFFRSPQRVDAVW
jgi:cytochrome P450